LSYLDQLKKAQTAMGSVVNPEQVAMDKLVAERSTGAAEAKKELEADIASRADQFKGKEERIGKREAELDKSKDLNTAWAFVRGGLRMLEERGPALAAIAKGAGVGVDQYQSGIKDIKAAQEKLDEARDRIEELRQNQSTMDKREIRAANKDIRDASLAGQQYQLDARMKIYGENRADARAGIASDIARSESALDRQNRIQVASMPGDQQRMLTALGGKGGLEAGLAKMQEIQTDKTGAAYAKLFTETVAEANKAGTTPPTAAQFAASLRQLSAAMNPTKVPGAVDVATPGRT
jgi:DNA repair exonuclease SbcCD ATPase subunit